MNILDVSEGVPKTTDFLGSMLARQEELMKKYQEIEIQNGFFYPNWPFDLHSNVHQAKLKDFAWRVTEELAEATEALATNDRVHFLEELSDAVHFLLELMVCSEVLPSMSLQAYFNDAYAYAYTDEKFIRPRCFDVIEHLGLAMNCLKNKAWKNTHLMTDVTKYRSLIRQAWDRMIGLARQAGLNAEEFYVLYYKKSMVNQFRQRSNY